MNRVFATTFILMLLIPALVGIQPLSLARAASNIIWEPPVITILSPERKAYATNSITLSFSVSVGKALEDVHYVHLASVYYKGDWQQNETLVDYRYYYDGYHLVAFSCNLTGIPEGYRSILIYAREVVSISLNNMSYSSSKSITFLAVDTTPPSISVLSPETRAYDASNVSLDFVVNEATSQLKYCLDGQDNVTVTGNTTLTELPNGNHNITIYGDDKFGNLGTSETITFTIEEPFPTTLVAVSVAVIVAAVSFALVAYFLRRKAKRNKA